MTTPEDLASILPHHLFERTRRLNERTLSSRGSFVLCWLHHAIRDHENPALDVAVTIGNALDRPVLVYQGLSGRHRFNSDRHHVFILQGARDMHDGLARRGITSVFHLPAVPETPSPLRVLMREAAAFVTEDFPAPPFPKWTERWASTAECAALAVDAACLMPIRIRNSRPTRAFAFRNAAQSEWDGRLRDRWIDVEPEVEPFSLDSIELPFDSAQLDDDPCLLAANCVIDHSVPPVRHFVGGSHAGYARWDEFRNSGLRSYHRRRNDAADLKGVSGLSPYLHHGHVSPFRIAREAHETGGAGAEKFLDELLVWRELAYNFCARTHPEELESLSAIPDWAQDTLAAHAHDARDAIMTWECLARGCTGDRLWDAAQQSLLRHGELHNNIRMTWGKMIPGWSASPAEALRVLIDLNHRFALDGNNPNSYGGLLWCLGQFDRPFSPEIDVLGSIRPRSTESHRTRLDPERYERAIRDRSAVSSIRVAVVGGGMAGLAAARTLHDQDCAVVVFDRGRSVGGRMSTRRMSTQDQAEFRFDHGAPCFQVTDPRFGRFVRSWIADGVCARWDVSRVSLAGSEVEAIESPTFVVGTPSMNSICQHMARDLDVRCGATVERLERCDDGRWSITVDGASLDDRFDAVIVAAASTQVRRLVDGHEPCFQDALHACRERPQWVAMMQWPRVEGVLPDLLELPDHPVLERLVHDSAKPGRADDSPLMGWVAHAHSAWSESRLDESRELIASTLAAETVEVLRSVTGVEIDVDSLTLVHAHRWSFAQSALSSETECLSDDALQLAVAGAMRGGSGVEAAFLSGQAAAGRVLGWRPDRPADQGEQPLLFTEARS